MGGGTLENEDEFTARGQVFGSRETVQNNNYSNGKLQTALQVGPGTHFVRISLICTPLGPKQRHFRPTNIVSRPKNKKTLIIALFV